MFEIIHEIQFGSQINNYLAEVSNNNEHISLINIGKSYQNREMLGVKISSGGDKKKPAVFIDAGIHAREWIAPTTALYVISQLANATNKHLYENVDWYILPQINPDGYEYSHTEVSVNKFLLIVFENSSVEKILFYSSIVCGVKQDLQLPLKDVWVLMETEILVINGWVCDFEPFL